MHDVNALDLIPYEPGSFYVIDKAYWHKTKLVLDEMEHELIKLRIGKAKTLNDFAVNDLRTRQYLSC